MHQAVFYPFHLSYPDFDARGKRMAQPICDELRGVSPILTKFVDAGTSLGRVAALCSIAISIAAC